jgi:glycosyltransferase involved in cell wall biosynthesis
VDTKLFERRETSDVRREKTSRPASNASRRENPLSLLCVARIDRQKNQMMIVEALAAHPEMTARPVGPVTQQDYRDELGRRAAELGVADRVAFVGALKPGSRELAEEYSKADVFVLPSRHEPFGIAVLEAWAAALPVVASDVGGLGRLCAAHPGAAIVFRAGDAADLGRALDEMSRLVASGAAAKMSAEGKKAALQYDWGSLSARLVGFYGEL